jgi:NAD(P)-dependent dehydrogenase (short-subunit alcohol dehydrogenase family)
MNTISFKSKVAIVTGAGGGLGRVFALDLARRGAFVLVNDLGGAVRGGAGTATMADGVVAEIRAAGGTALANYDSVSTQEGGKAIVQAALDAFGRVDVLIGCAGNLRSAAFEDITEDDWDSIHSIHLKGQFNVAQPAYKVMKTQGYGRILFVASAVGMFGGAYQVAYGAAKAGVVGMMHSLANEATQHGVIVNTLLPTAASRMEQEMHPDAMAKFAAVPPAFFAAGMTPEFNVPLVTYLVSDKNETTHAIYTSAGGRYARVFVGVTDGWQSPRNAPSQAEDVLAHIGEIENRKNVNEFHSIADEFIKISAGLKL